MELNPGTTTFMVIRRKCDGKYFRARNGKFYRLPQAWTDNLKQAYLIGPRARLTCVLNQMRRDLSDTRREWERDQWDLALNPVFDPNEFQVEEVELRTTGLEVAF